MILGNLPKWKSAGIITNILYIVKGDESTQETECVMTIKSLKSHSNSNSTSQNLVL